MSTAIPAIEVKNVYKSYKDVHAVRGIDLQIGQGQFVAILGPNGAGKTTLVEMIEGIQKPDSGKIHIMGKAWHGHEHELNTLIGLSLQETRFMDKITARETLMLFASFYNLGKKRVDEILQLINLEEKRKAYVENLSGGQRQRLALGIALLNKPRVLLLDEPTTGLDPNARREIWAILRQLKEQENTSLVLTTHYMEEAEQLCDHIVIIDSGKILKEGNLEELMDGEKDKNVLEFNLEEPLPSANIFNICAFQVEWKPELNKGKISIEGNENELAIFFSFLKKENLRLQNMAFRKKTLDDLFTNLTGRHLNE